MSPQTGMAAQVAAMLLTVTQAAHTLGVSRQRVHQLIKTDHLDAAKHGGGWVITAASVVAFSRARTIAATEMADARARAATEMADARARAATEMADARRAVPQVEVTA